MLPDPLPISDDEIEKNGGKVLRGPDGSLSGKIHCSPVSVVLRSCI